MGWGGGRSTKKIRVRDKVNEKNSCTPINPKKYSCYGLKKIHTRNLITKKNSYGSKIPLPPITFLIVRPLGTMGKKFLPLKNSPPPITFLIPCNRKSSQIASVLVRQNNLLHNVVAFNHHSLAFCCSVLHLAEPELSLQPSSMFGF